LANLLRDELIALGAQVETFSVADKTLTLKPCIGCMSCTKTGECVQHDSTQQLHTALEAADALIWIAPLFFASIPAQLKGVIDRMMVFWSRRNAPAARAAHPMAEEVRPASAFIIAGSDDPFKTDAAVIPIRYASNCAGYRLRKPLGVSGPSSPGAILDADYADFRAQVIEEIHALIAG
jgi:multimeric flavodoxin WrbA